MIKGFIAMAIWLVSIVMLASGANAGIFDAITGHINDVKDRITHVEEVIEGNVLATSEFRNSDVGRDAIHWANGSASLVQRGDEYYLQLNGDFVTGPAPDLYVYVADRKVVDEGTFWNAERIELAKLKSGSGAQAYKLESISEHMEIVIWCKRFGAFIGATTLKG